MANKLIKIKKPAGALNRPYFVHEESGLLCFRTTNYRDILACSGILIRPVASGTRNHQAYLGLAFSDAISGLQIGSMADLFAAFTTRRPSASVNHTSTIMGMAQSDNPTAVTSPPATIADFELLAVPHSMKWGIARGYTRAGTVSSQNCTLETPDSGNHVPFSAYMTQIPLGVTVRSLVASIFANVHDLPAATAADLRGQVEAYMTRKGIKLDHQVFQPASIGQWFKDTIGNSPTSMIPFMRIPDHLGPVIAPTAAGAVNGSGLVTSQYAYPTMPFVGRFMVQCAGIGMVPVSLPFPYQALTGPVLPAVTFGTMCLDSVTAVHPIDYPASFPAKYAGVSAAKVFGHQPFAAFYDLGTVDPVDGCAPFTPKDIGTTDVDMIADAKTSIALSFDKDTNSSLTPVSMGLATTRSINEARLARGAGVSYFDTLALTPRLISRLCVDPTVTSGASVDWDETIADLVWNDSQGYAADYPVPS